MLYNVNMDSQKGQKKKHYRKNQNHVQSPQCQCNNKQTEILNYHDHHYSPDSLAHLWTQILYFLFCSSLFVCCKSMLISLSSIFSMKMVHHHIIMHDDTEFETFMITLHRKLQFPMSIYSVVLSLCYHNLITLDKFT